MGYKLHEHHKELMHYTTAAGLQGIVTSKTLWAGHASFMNDSEEIVGFSTRILPAILRSEVDKYHANEEEVVAASRLGIDLTEQKVEKFVAGFKEAEEATDHYITSFCTSGDDQVSENGLLSQWRGYGLDGGYAIVFACEDLNSLLERESQMYYEERILLAEVQYDMANLSEVTDPLVLEHIQNIKNWVKDLLSTNGRNPDHDQAAESNSLLSILCKHRGFGEEKEVRIVVSEPSAKIGPDPQNNTGKPYREVRSCLRNGVSVPVLHLFENQDLNTLPIRRVIVGPHPDKGDRRKAVEILLNNNNIHAEVVVSDTPFRGR